VFAPVDNFIITARIVEELLEKGLAVAVVIANDLFCR
jgi:hypothetical protein